MSGTPVRLRELSDEQLQQVHDDAAQELATRCGVMVSETEVSLRWLRPRPDHGSFYSLFKLRVQAIQLGIGWPDDSNAQKRLRLWLRQREVGLKMRRLASEHRVRNGGRA